MKSPTSPKINVMRLVATKLAPLFRRLFAELSRAQPAPATAAKLMLELNTQTVDQLEYSLGKATYPVINLKTADQWPTSGEAWVYQPLCGERNVSHARLPVSVQMAHVLNGTLTTAAVYFPIEDLIVIAEPGTGASEGTAVSGSRLRVSGRHEVNDALLLLPMSSIDTENYKIMTLADKHNFHTRKSGHPLFDAIDVASGRADAALLTHLTPLESAIAQLLIAEAGGKATTIAGEKPTPTSADLLIANPKLHTALLPLFA